MKNWYLLSIVVIQALSAFSQKAGNLDSTFGTNGISQVAYTDSGSARFRALNSLPDGKIIASGYCYKNGKTRMMAARYKSDGNLDSSFGNQGVALLHYPGATANFSYCSKIYNTDGLVLGGDIYSTNYSFAAAVIDNTGNLKNNFGNNGFAIMHVGATNADNVGNSIAVQPDGKIIVSGISTGNGNSDFTAVRFTKEGKTDSTFGTNGSVVLPIGTGNDNCYSMALQADGKILLGGDIQQGSYYVFALARLLNSGKLDSSFGQNGVVIKPIGSADDDYGYSLLVQADKKILLGGTAKIDVRNNFTILRFLENGNPDSSFGVNGVFQQGFSANSSDYGQVMALHPSNGKIAMSGRTYVSGSSFGTMVINPNGTIDSTFGLNGVVYNSMGNAQHYVYGNTFEPSGKIVVAGDALISYPIKLTLLRYHTFFPSFGLQNKNIDDFNFTFYPNPGDNELHIDLSKSSNIQLSIRNLLGTEFITEQKHGMQFVVDISSLPSGTFIVELSSELGHMTKQFIKL